MDDKWKINLSMADATYPVWIKPEDEEIVRKAAQQVNDILKEYREKWPNVEKERIMAFHWKVCSKNNVTTRHLIPKK